MSPTLEVIPRIALVGIGATAVLDLWTLGLRRLGVPTLDMALVGRWAGHALHGQWSHERIAQAPQVKGEGALGWLLHYAIGIGFAALLVLVAGPGWVRDPSFTAAIAVGIVTVAAPWFVMQPAMGAGFASSRTPSPWKSRLRNLANHAVFGIGMYASAAALARLLP